MEKIPIVEYGPEDEVELPPPSFDQEPTYFEGQGFVRPGPPFKMGHHCVRCGQSAAPGSWTCHAHPWGPGLRYGEILENAGVNHPLLLKVKESWALPDNTNPGSLMPEAFPVIALEADSGNRARAVELLRMEMRADSTREQPNPHYVAMLARLEKRVLQALDWPEGRPDNRFGIRIAEPREQELQLSAWRAYQAGAEALLAEDAPAGARHFAEARRLWNNNRSGTGDLGRALVEAAKVSAFL
jgi:hypothetical protein